MKVKLKKKSAKNEEENEEMYVRLGDVPLDILRYNISMQSGVERKETRKSLLLKMGAKKPKNPYINYKELMQNKAKAKAEAEAFAFDRSASFVNKKLPLKQAKRNGKTNRKTDQEKKYPSHGSIANTWYYVNVFQSSDLYIVLSKILSLEGLNKRFSVVFRVFEPFSSGSQVS
ncbi:unnamed protein product [Schistosoma mattheei]|uniref:Uncharacterized protein n=1 Tax=Schistosoma mattheei TaxID=31246 RepID=A0AA85B2V4_9TREM|nr:unnamed protein product [Schistosoma mattheei]